MKKMKSDKSSDNLLGAIARGWTHPQNSNKPLDAELAVAIEQEVIEFIERNKEKIV